MGFVVAAVAAAVVGIVIVLGGVEVKRYIALAQIRMLVQVVRSRRCTRRYYS